MIHRSGPCPIILHDQNPIVLGFGPGIHQIRPLDKEEVRKGVKQLPGEGETLDTRKRLHIDDGWGGKPKDLQWGRDVNGNMA